MDIFDAALHCGCNGADNGSGSAASYALRAIAGVHHTHSHLIAVESYSRLDQALGQALTEVLGPAEADALKSALLTREHSAEAYTPSAQAVLLGLAELAPTASEAILSRTRHYYGTVPAAIN